MNSRQHTLNLIKNFRNILLTRRFAPGRLSVLCNDHLRAIQATITIQLDEQENESEDSRKHFLSCLDKLTAPMKEERGSSVLQRATYFDIEYMWESRIGFASFSDQYDHVNEGFNTTVNAISLLQTIVNNLKQIPAETIFTYLERQNKDGQTIGSNVSLRKNSRLAQRYFALLGTLLKNGLVAEKVLSHLNQANQSWRYGSYTKEDVNDIVDFVLLLAAKGADHEGLKVFLSQKRSDGGYNIYDLLVKNPDSFTKHTEKHAVQFYLLFKLGLFPLDTQSKISNFKGLLVSAIKAIPDEKMRMVALREASGIGMFGEKDPVYQLLSKEPQSAISRLFHFSKHLELDTVRQELERLSGEHSHQTTESKALSS